MRKGKFGVAYAFYAVLAIAFLLFGWNLQAVAVLLVCMCIEADEWASKQIIQCLSLIGIKLLVFKVLDVIQSPFETLRYKINNDIVDTILNSIVSIFNGIENIISLAFFVLLIVAIVKVCKEQDLNFPLVNKISDWAYGKVTKKEEAK